jgi:nickel/cobalt transporter (NicO) family protein
VTLFRTTLVLTGLALAASAHPMGNFSVNHYSRLYFNEKGLQLTYVLDLAEIPTFQLLGSWQADSKDQTALDAKTRQQAAEWVSNLTLRQGEKRIPWGVKSVAAKTSDGAGGMAVLRIAITAEANVAAGAVTYEDANFPGRAGWKEIVIESSDRAVLHSASPAGKDLSGALTFYRTDPSVNPPQDVTASVEWAPVAISSALPAVSSQTSANPVAKAPVAAEDAKEPAAPATASFTEQQPTGPGTVVRGDFLSRMLQQKELGWRLMALGLLAAFGLGAMHAMSPGHGKTIVAAYLVGSRGTMKHAGLLGLVVTFTHTFTVFLLGIGVLFFQQYVVPEKIVPALGAISGLSIVVVGISLLYKRAKALLGMGHGHHHHHHSHSNAHGHDHGFGEHGHTHAHGELVHSHGGSTHSHMVEGDITPGNLIALGVSGGMVPCPSALILMLSAIALGRPGFGLVLLVGFSAGLALVLMSIGMLALYARHLLPDGKKTAQNPAFRLIPVFSAVVVICLGLAITAVSAGWLKPMRFLS